MVDFIEEHREEYGVESICEVLPIAPSTFHRHRTKRVDPDRRSDREKRDDALKPKIRKIWEESFGGVYGARKVWHQLLLDGERVARCTVERLMREMGLRGAVRGRAFKVTTVTDESLARPDDLVERRFEATHPNQLWVADITYVATWNGWAYVAYVVDVFSRRIVGWRVTNSLRTDIALDALEQAIAQRCPVEGLIHHSDRGTQCLSIRYTDRLAEAGLVGSVGSVGDSYDNAMAESIIGLFKTEVIRRCGPWRSVDEVEYAVLEWVDWFNNKRLYEPLGYVSPAAFEKAYHQAEETAVAVAALA